MEEKIPQLDIVFSNLSSGKQNTSFWSNSGQNLTSGDKNTVIGAKANVKNFQGNDATNQTVIGLEQLVEVIILLYWVTRM